MKNNKKINNYIITIEKLVVDDEIKKEIIEKLEFYRNHGKIYFDKCNLYGTYINTRDLNRANPAKEFFEIKILDNDIICNYSEWSNKKIINISQNGIRGGNTKIYKKEITTNAFTCNNNNVIEMKEIEKIYNYQKIMIFESKLKKQSDYNTYPEYNSNIVYNEYDFLSNSLTFEKKWYIPNGSIIKYCLSKSFLNEKDLIEKYLICPESNLEDETKTFVDLDKDDFKKFMSGTISINEVLYRNRESKKLILK